MKKEIILSEGSRSTTKASLHRSEFHDAQIIYLEMIIYADNKKKKEKKIDSVILRLNDLSRLTEWLKEVK